MLRLAQIPPSLKQPFFLPTWENYKGQIKQQALTFIAVLALSLIVGYGGSKLFTNLQTQTAITQFVNASKKEKIVRFFCSAVLPPIWEEVPREAVTKLRGLKTTLIGT